jgi:hypothetical protein
MRQNTKRFAKTAVSLVVLVLAMTSAASAFNRVSRVEAFDTDIWTVWVSGGDRRVVVEGDGDTDLDCYVYDMAGRLLGKDDDRTDYCIVDIWRANSGNVKVHIANLGDVYNRYELRVN